MATTNGNRKILDLKRWEFCTPAPASTSSGAFIASSRHYKQQQLYVVSSSVQYLYNPSEDGWVQIPSGALTGTFGAGAAGAATSIGPSGTATAGTTTTLTTNLTLARDLRGYSIHITAGPGAGDTRVIASNTIGTNSVITVTSPFSTAITTSSTYRLITPRWYVLSSGSMASNSFKYYDYALNSWNSSTLAIAGFIATLGTEGKMMSTPSWIDSDYLSFATGTATSASGTTLVNSAKTWTTNQWTNYQVRIVSGTGAGQIRGISSNTGTTLTVPAWTITPDATSVYSIEGNDDFIYYSGVNPTAIYRYSISGNSWSALATRTAPGAGMSANWVHSVDDSAWTSESAIQNGKYFYSFRGGSSAAIDRYDIAANTWSVLTYAPGTETFTTGSKHTLSDEYIYSQKDATGRCFRYNVLTFEQDGWTTILYPNGTGLVGDTMFDVTYKDGATEITYIYMILNSSTIMLRQMVI